MAAPAPRNFTWSNEQDAYAGSVQGHSQPIFSRPSVTTGATLPWGGKASSNLGPPRAFHSGPHSVPTITVTSNQSGVANFVCKPDSARTVLHSPFAEIAADKEVADQDGSTGNVMPSGSADARARLEPALALEMEDITAMDFPEQGSLQSAVTSFALESGQPSAAGHVITTAQDEQGVAITLDGAPQVGELNGKSALFFQSMPQPPHQGVVTTNASLQTKDPPGGNSPGRQMQSSPGQEGSPHEGSTNRRAGLRSGDCLEPRDMQKQGIEDLQAADLLAMDAQSSDLDPEDDGLNSADQRKIRRRNNNRESAKRVREKRDADLTAVNRKVARLQEAQSQLLEHCSKMDNTCRDLSGKLQAVRNRLESSQAENVRLMTEIEHLRRNVNVGDQRLMGCHSGGHEGYQGHHKTAVMTSGGMDDPFGGLVWGQQGFNPLTDQYSQDWKHW